MKNKIHNFIKNNKESILKDYIDLLKIPSISETEACKDALSFIKELYNRYGFEAEQYDDYLLAHYEKGEKSIGLFAHADVVPVDDKWTVTAPFEPKIVDGEIYARGTIDNKSAVIASLYAFRAIKELNLPIKTSLLAFAGANEESTMQDVKNYVKAHTPPDFSLVLDAGFPVYYGDKGMLWLELTLNRELDDLISISGGSACNIILGEARATVKYKSALLKELQEQKEICAEQNGDTIEIYAKGISNHGAVPMGSINAGGIILSALFNAPSFSQADKSALKLVRELLCTYDGSPFGIKSNDSTYGDTTVTNGIIKVEKGKLIFTVDIRYGSTYTENSLISHLEELFKAEDITYRIVKKGQPRHIDLNSPYVCACIKAYRDHTGNYDAKPRINAGGTYLRYLPSSVEIGTTTKSNDCTRLPQGHGKSHQPDEHMNLEGFYDGIEIIIKMILECDACSAVRQRINY